VICFLLVFNIEASGNRNNQYSPMLNPKYGRSSLSKNKEFIRNVDINSCHCR